jgi:hypothetical protein
LLQLVRRVGETGCGYRLILFGFLSQSSKTKAMAAMPSVAHPRTAEPGDTPVGSGELAQVKDQAEWLLEPARPGAGERIPVFTRECGGCAQRRSLRPAPAATGTPTTSAQRVDTTCAGTGVLMYEDARQVVTPTG